MNEKTKAAVEAAVELFKGWVRPLVVLYLTVLIGVMTIQGTVAAIPWQFWTIYAGFAGEWLGERAVKRFIEIKSTGITSKNTS